MTGQTTEACLGNAATVRERWAVQERARLLTVRGSEACIFCDAGLIYFYSSPTATASAIRHPSTNPFTSTYSSVV